MLKSLVIKSKNIFIQNGVGIGDFLIDDTFYGKYYIQAYTNFMKNFGDEIVELIESKQPTSR